MKSTKICQINLLDVQGGSLGQLSAMPLASYMPPVEPHCPSQTGERAASVSMIILIRVTTPVASPDNDRSRFLLPFSGALSR